MTTTTRIFYECGICSCIHLWNWNGDCRENAARFNLDDLSFDDELKSWEDRQEEDRQWDCFRAFFAALQSVKSLAVMLPTNEEDL